MSAHAPVSKETIKELFVSLVEEEEAFDREAANLGTEGEVYAGSLASRSALMRAAGFQGGEAFALDATEGAIEAADEKRKRYACDFIKAAYLMLGIIEKPVPGDARDFILLLLAMSGGHSKQKLIISDDRLANLSGLTDRTIRRKRAAYRAWEQSSGWSVIELYEQRRNPQTGHTPPCEYRVTFADHVARFVREWRTYYQQRRAALPAAEGATEGEREEANERPGLWSDMRREKESSAFAESTSPEVVGRIVERITSDFNVAPIPGRKSKDAHKPQPKDVIAHNEAKMVDLVRQCRDESRRRGRGAYSWWTDFKRKIAVVLAEETPGFPDPGETDDMG